jgi:lysophospholipase L1-like esterase
LPAKNRPFAGSYKDLIDFLKPRAEALVLVGVPPLEMNGPLAVGYFAKTISKENDAIIKTIAKAASIQFADVRSTMTGEHLTIDGVHLRPDGYRGWITAISAAVSKAQLSSCI